MALYYNFFSKMLTRHLRQFFIRRTHTEVAASANDRCATKQKIEKAPFMKNLFLGNVDKEVLYFAEVDSAEGNSTVVCEPKDQTEGIIEEEKTFERLFRNGICRMGLPDTYGGTPCLSTHLINQIEKYDIDLNTSFLLDMQYSFIINTILNFGSESQKNLYLKDLMSGKVVGAYAYHEESAGSDLASIQCTVVPQKMPDNNISYSLNGEKSWVTKGSTANFFIVLAVVKNINRESGPEELSAIIIDRKAPGITITKQENMLGDSDICKLKFDNVQFTPENIIGRIGAGYDIAVSNLESNKFMFISSVLNLIRKLSSQVTNHVSQVNRFLMPLREYELVQHRLSTVIAILYALESSVYHLAGMKDTYSMDTSLESVIVQNLICSYGMSAINYSLGLMGTKSFNSSFPYNDVVDNFSLLSRSFTSPENYQLYISLIGLEYVGRQLSDAVTKMRNPLNYPKFILKRMWYTRGQVKDSPTLNKNLYMEYHPTLRANAEQLEYCICRLQYCFETLLSQYGKDCVNRQVDLIRLSDVISDIFTMVAVLARASRSYCTGIRYSDQEIAIANVWCYNTTKRIKINIADILGSKLSFSDNALLKVASDVLQNKGYFFVSPVERNIK